MNRWSLLGAGILGVAIGLACSLVLPFHQSTPSSTGGAAAAKAVEESTDFEVILTEAPAEKKIGIIKAIHELTGLGLKEAKDAVEGAPKVIKDHAPKAEAQRIKNKIEEAGATITLKGL